MILFMMCPVGIGVALVRRSARAVPAGPAVRGDVPERLLRWAAGLLSARREEWGQAMLGELGHIDGRGRRWRFSAGCADAALLLPPWADPNGITSRAETRSSAGWIRLHPPLGHGGQAKFQPRAKGVPASVSHALTPEPSQAKDPSCFVLTAVGRIR
jgi:hypothetical protein